MFALAGTSARFASARSTSVRPASARRTALVAIALLVGLIATLMAGPGAANAAPAHRHHAGHHRHHAGHHHKHHNRHHNRHHARHDRHADQQHRLHATTEPPGDHERTPEQVIANSLLEMLNAERRAHQLPAMTMNTELVESAHEHNLWMARTNVMSHQETGESDLGTRISKTGYKWTWAGENIGWNSRMNKAGVLQLESIMYHEKAPDNGHRLNILSSHFRNIGVDVYMDKANDKVWLTTDFGRH